jgi:hypothetical protein
MRLLFTSLIRSSANVSVIVLIRITHCFPAPSERSLQCVSSSSNGSDSRENIKSFDRLNRLNFVRFASTEDTAIQTATLIFSLRPRCPHRSLVIAYVGHRVSVRIKFLCEPVSSVSIVSGYVLDDRAVRFDPRQRRKDFSSILCVQTGSGAHPASCTMGTGGPFFGAKARPRRDTDH